MCNLRIRRAGSSSQYNLGWAARWILNGDMDMGQAGRITYKVSTFTPYCFITGLVRLCSRILSSQLTVGLWKERGMGTED